MRLRPHAPTRRASALRRAGPRRLARGHPGRGETGAGRRAMRSKRHRVRRSERAAARHGRLGRQRRPRPPREALVRRGILVRGEGTRRTLRMGHPSRVHVVQGALDDTTRTEQLVTDGTRAAAARLDQL